MTLKMLKPGLGYLRGGLPLIQHRAPDQVVERLRGSALMGLRKRLLARSGGLCECDVCQAGYPLAINNSTMEADHVVPVSEGGDNSIGNFRALHRDCHARVTAEQAAARHLSGRTWSDKR